MDKFAEVHSTSNTRVENSKKINTHTLMFTHSVEAYARAKTSYFQADKKLKESTDLSEDQVASLKEQKKMGRLGIIEGSERIRTTFTPFINGFIKNAFDTSKKFPQIEDFCGHVFSTLKKNGIRPDDFFSTIDTNIFKVGKNEFEHDVITGACSEKNMAAWLSNEVATFSLNVYKGRTEGYSDYERENATQRIINVLSDLIQETVNTSSLGRTGKLEAEPYFREALISAAETAVHIVAAKRFDDTKGVRFITYVRAWIVKAVQDEERKLISRVSEVPYEFAMVRRAFNEISTAIENNTLTVLSQDGWIQISSGPTLSFIIPAEMVEKYVPDVANAISSCRWTSAQLENTSSVTSSVIEWHQANDPYYNMSGNVKKWERDSEIYREIYRLWVGTLASLYFRFKDNPLFHWENLESDKKKYAGTSILPKKVYDIMRVMDGQNFSEVFTPDWGSEEWAPSAIENSASVMPDYGLNVDLEIFGWFVQSFLSDLSEADRLVFQRKTWIVYTGDALVHGMTEDELQKFLVDKNIINVTRQALSVRMKNIMRRLSNMVDWHFRFNGEASNELLDIPEWEKVWDIVFDRIRSSYDKEQSKKDTEDDMDEWFVSPSAKYENNSLALAA